MSSAVPLLLSPKEVNLLKQSPTPVSILDATWFMPNVARNARDEFLSKRVPGAQFLDLDDVASSHELGLKHMMPDQKTFSQACGRTLQVLRVICFFLKMVTRKAWRYTFISRSAVRIQLYSIVSGSAKSLLKLRHSRCLLLASRFVYVSIFWASKLKHH